jgi:hypothetical protein
MYKTVFSFSFLVAAFLFTGCEFSVGAKKDLNTGLSVRYNGLNAEHIFLAGADDSPLSTSDIVLGSQVKIIADGVTNFKEVNSKVYPGCSILLVGPSNDSIFYVPDAYQDLSEGKPANEATYLTALLNTGDPMQVNSTYLLKVRFYDKQDTAHFIRAECALKMTEPAGK